MVEARERGSSGEGDEFKDENFIEKLRQLGADFVIAVDGRTSFTNVEYGDRYTYCPTAQVPRAIRQEWGDLSGR